MKTPVRLALYLAALVAVFGAAFGIGGLVVPESAVHNWTQQTDTHDNTPDGEVSEHD